MMSILITYYRSLHCIVNVVLLNTFLFYKHSE